MYIYMYLVSMTTFENVAAAAAAAVCPFRFVSEQSEPPNNNHSSVVTHKTRPAASVAAAAAAAAASAVMVTAMLAFVLLHCIERAHTRILCNWHCANTACALYTVYVDIIYIRPHAYMRAFRPSCSMQSHMRPHSPRHRVAGFKTSVQSCCVFVCV